MPERSVDPARLSGEALRRWYLRSPDEIAAEKQAAEAQRYQDFFNLAKSSGDRTANELEGEALRQWYLRSPEEIERARQATADARYTAFYGRAERPPATFGGAGVAQPPPHQAGRGSASEDEPDPTFAWSPVGPDRWRRDEVHDFPEAKPAPLGSPVLGPREQGSRPVPASSMELPGGRPTPLPLPPTYPTASLASAAGYRTSAQAVRPISYHASQPAPTKGARQQAAAARPQRHGIWIAGRQPGELDPSRTEVFKPGPDEKLHPVPGWRTTGPFAFDEWSRMFDWGGVAGDLTDITTGALDFMGGGGLAGEIVRGAGYKIGPDIVRGILHGHHSWPKFMGGPSKQDLARLYESIHGMFHDDLAKALKEAGFPRVGGRGGGTADWTEYFRLNPGKQEEAMEILQRVTREFDKKNGTKISKYLDDALAKGKAPPSSPPK